MRNKAKRHRKTSGAATPDCGAAVAAARPKVKELLAEYQADPTGDAAAIVEILMLNQLAGEPGREAEAIQQERGRRGTLEGDSGQSSTQLARQNRRKQAAVANDRYAPHLNAINDFGFGEPRLRLLEYAIKRDHIAGVSALLGLAGEAGDKAF